MLFLVRTGSFNVETPMSEENFKHETMRRDNGNTLPCVNRARTLKAPYGGDRLRRSIQNLLQLFRLLSQKDVSGKEC